MSFASGCLCSSPGTPCLVRLLSGMIALFAAVLAGDAAWAQEWLFEAATPLDLAPVALLGRRGFEADELIVPAGGTTYYTGDFDVALSEGPLFPLQLELPPAPRGEPDDPGAPPTAEDLAGEEAATDEETIPDGEEKEEEHEEPKDPRWYKKYSIRGYSQIRYNRHLETNPFLRHPQDRSVGMNNSFLIRRARLVFSGDAHERVFIYIQPDFASATGGHSPLHFLQLRDWYADIAFDELKEYRVRVGQSKVPYGFENLQSSQNRIPLDRNDALNSGVPNERDLGAFFYWAPAEKRELFSYLVSSGLKGSGDYGVIGLGVYNGQSANRPERNDDRHLIARFAYPFLLPNGQIIEPNIAAYRGLFFVDTTPGIIGGNFPDRRIAWSFVLYPQPLGFQAEYTIGVGPELNEARTAVETGKLHGGYAMLFYRYELHNGGVLLPFIRKQYYRGGTKALPDAPRQRINEFEAGVEWEPFPQLEFTGLYALMNRTSTEFPYQNEKGGLLRLQVQWNY